MRLSPLKSTASSLLVVRRVLRLTVSGGSAAKLDRLATALEKEPKLLLDESLDILTFYAMRSSNGPLTKKMLILADHPYATRHASPPPFPGVINNQSGVLLSSWRRRTFVNKGYVFNVSKEAAFLDTGTKNMVSRPLPDYALALSQPRIAKMVRSHERRLEALLR